MAKYVKLILFLWLTFSLHGIMFNSFADKAEKGRYIITSLMTSQDRIGIPEFSYSLVAELAISLQSVASPTTMNRLQRVLIGEYNYFMKNILLDYADREISLLQHLGHIYNTSISYFCRNASEYYVFALRRILI